MPDNETPEEWKERVRSIGSISKYKPGASIRKPVKNEERGGTAGYHVEHHDGSQDAVATPRSVNVTAKMKQED